MKIHLYQNDIEWENPEENIIRANKSLSEIDISSGDLIILPEMFSTGFSMRSELCIEMEQEKNKTLHFLQRLAILNSCCVIAGVTTKKTRIFLMNHWRSYLIKKSYHIEKIISFLLQKST